MRASRGQGRTRTSTDTNLLKERACLLPWDALLKLIKTLFIVCSLWRSSDAPQEMAAWRRTLEPTAGRVVQGASCETGLEAAEWRAALSIVMLERYREEARQTLSNCAPN